jgi:sugar lactone lactonase YvrE
VTINMQKIYFPARHTSCPAFGGSDYRSVYCTSAREGLGHPSALDGAGFVTKAPAVGLAECAVDLADG